MKHEEIVTRMCLIYPSEVIYEITMETVISAIIRRLGEKALDLSVEDLELARDEVKLAIEHHLDERDFIEMGLDAWEIVRNLQSQEQGKITILYEGENHERRRHENFENRGMFIVVRSLYPDLQDRLHE